MTSFNPRDFPDDGQNSPNPRWPGGARMAVNVVMNDEEGSEPSTQDGEFITSVIA